MKRLKPLWVILVLALAFTIGIISITAVLNSSVRVLYFGILHGHTMSAMRAQITTLVQKVVCATVMLVSGIYCIYLYMQTYESEEFLQLSVLFFMTAGVIMTLIDQNVLFYATAGERAIWNICADVFLLMFVFLLLFDSMAFATPKQRRIFIIGSSVLHLGLCAARLMMTTSAFMSVMRVYAGIVPVALVVLIALRMKQEHSMKPLKSIAVMLPMCLLLFVINDAKFDTKSTFSNLYQNQLPYLLVIYTELLFFARFQVHRMAVMLGKVSKRQLQEGEQYREMTMRTFMLYCQQPINGLNRIAQRLEDTPNKQLDGGETAAAIRGELRALSHSVDNALQHVQIRNSPLRPDFGQVSMALVFGHVKDELELAQCGAVRLSKDSKDAPVVQGDPNMLIRANYTLLTALNEAECAPMVTVSLKPKEDTLQIIINAEYDELTRHRQFTMLNRLRKIYSVCQRVPDEELTLTIAKAILAAHNARLDVHFEGRVGIRMTYELPLWRATTAPQASKATDDMPNQPQQSAGNQHAIHVAVLSTSRRQAEFIRICLPAPIFDLSMFSKPDDFEQCILTEHINVVIIGTVFMQADIAGLCKRIRSKFTLGLLPIILMRPSGSNAIESYFYQYINDFVFEPCVYDELNQRVLSLALLQRSTESLRLSRLEFLQSQMDPHFIFNAISTIMPLCMQNPKKAYQLLGFFSDYLRGNLFPKEQNRPIHVYDEVDLIRAYLALENARTPDMIDYTIEENYDDECEIFPLLIEPLVENCVKHGLHRENGEVRKLHILVTITQHNTMMDIVVQDDGAGFDMDQPSSPQRTPGQKATHRSIGLSNLKARLRLYYHTDMQVESRKGQGTRVSFIVPCHCDMTVQENLNAFARQE